MPKLPFEDLNTTREGKVFKRWFFTTDGRFLSGRAMSKPFYIYEGFTQRGKKKWRRKYEVEMAEGDRVVLYAVRGAWRGWQVMEVQEDATLTTVEQHEGVAPWMGRKPRLDKPDEKV